MRKTYYHFPYLPNRLQGLGDLAYNFWFSWHSEALWLFQNLDRKLWDDVHHNPVRLLHEIDPQRLDDVAKDDDFLNRYDKVVSAYTRYMKNTNTWFSKSYPDHKNSIIAYFSMEFGIHECLPIYSGGLGVLAGDHLKSASDLGIPLVAVGLLYRKSYFTQFISLNGNQQTLYLYNDFSTMPIQLVRGKNGNVLIVRINLDHRTIATRVWQVQIGRISLYLLDTDFQENLADDRKITERLYVDDRDIRLLQEILLGIGGVAVLHVMGILPTVYHMNEGHSAFLALERIKRKLKLGMSLEEAEKKVRSSTVFTTHTPVPAGNEVFDCERVEQFLKTYWESIGMSKEWFFKLAQETNATPADTFNMTILALRLAEYANGVSQLHGAVARRMWQGLWPNCPVNDVPITSITNGIHTRTWMADQMKNLLDRYLGSGWRYELTNTELWNTIYKIPDEKIWEVHQELKLLLIEEIRRRLVKQREQNGESKEAIAEVERIVDPEVLTIGFARRFASYKRPTLLFHDRERLKRILSRGDFPVQIVFAGKAHPANQPGKALIQQINGESRNPEFGNRIVFVKNYDMAFANRLVSGVDVWLNTPRRPYEASGTSGMKVAVNGGLNLSIPDGWWPEGYNGKNGWTIGEDKEYYNEFEQDEADSQSLYEILEEKVVPLFYDRDESGLPRRWIQWMKESMRSLIPQFNTHRMLYEYVKKMYVPAMNEEIQ